STTLTSDDARWPATVLRGIDEVAALRQGEGGPILVQGSAQLGTALADAGLVDRYHLLVFPVLLGAGKHLFSATDKASTALRLVSHETYSNGVQKQIYDVNQRPGLQPGVDLNDNAVLADLMDGLRSPD
ncbi:MAG: dihydrofolate reductase family protein, partial [Ornithinimicrobium sp.]